MKITCAKEVGMVIKSKRKKMGYTQADIATASGFSISFISDLENGKSTAELEKTIFLMNLLGLNIFAEER